VNAERPDIPNFEFRFALDGKVAVFSVVGQLPREYHGAVEGLVLDLLREGCRYFLVDLSAADYVSSGGVGLMSYYRKILADKHGKMVLVRPPGHVLKRLKLVRLPTWMEIYDTREAALEALAALPG
jgi:anti-anti-sigma factor